MNRLTHILGIEHPIVQGPFGGGLSSPELAATVSNLGGLGSFGLHSFATEQFADIDARIKHLTNKPYALNLWVNSRDERVDTYTEEDHAQWQRFFKPYFDDLGLPLPERPRPEADPFERHVEEVLRLEPPVFSFIFGIPSRHILDECRKRGIRTVGTATTSDEALALEEAGVDAIVATGLEAGGHRASWLRSAEDSLTGLFSLIQQVTQVVKKPVIAAGGIATGEGVAAALALGAHGVQVGTAFLACDESNAPQAHKDKLFSPDARYTTLTRAFSGRLARGVRSRLSEDMKDHQEVLAPYPFQGALLRPLRAAAIAQDRTKDITFWSGQSAPLIRYRKATEVFADLLRGVHELHPFTKAEAG